MAIPGAWLYHFLPDSKRLLLRRGNDIQMWDISGKDAVRTPLGGRGKAEVLKTGGDAPYAVLIEEGRSLCWGNQNLSIADLRADPPEVTVKDMPVGGFMKSGGTGWVLAAKSNQLFYISKDKKVHRAAIKDGRIRNDEILPIPVDEHGYVNDTTPDGSKLVVWNGKQLQVWGLCDKEPKIAHRMTDQAAAALGNVVISPDGTWLAGKYGPTALFRLDSAEPKLAAWLDETDSAGPYGAVAFSRDSGKAIVANHNGLLRFWDLSGPEPRELAPFDPAATFVAPHQFLRTTFSPTSGSLVVRRFDVPAKKRLRLQRWQLGTRRPQPGPLLDTESLGLVSAAGPDRWVQTAHFDGYKSRQFRLAKDKIQQWGEPFGPDNVVGAVAPDGRMLVLISTDNRSHLEGWDVSGDVPRRKWELTRKDLALGVGWGDGSIGRIWFSADNRWFATQARPDKDGDSWKLVLWRNTTPTPEVHVLLPITWGGYRALFRPLYVLRLNQLGPSHGKRKSEICF